MEVKLSSEREMYKDFSKLFAIIKATEKLEKAYVGDIISPADYESEFQNLKTLSFTLKDITPSIEHFIDTYQMEYPAALNRLVTSGSPATMEHGGAVMVECVQNMDSCNYDLYVSLSTTVPI